MEFRISGLLTVDNILSSINPLDIYSRYSTSFRKINVHFKAEPEFRKDPKPSAIIFYHNNTYLYKDFGEDGALNCFQFVSRKFSISFKEVLEKLNEDFNLYLGGSGSGSGVKYKYRGSSYSQLDGFKTIITVKRREFEEHDLIWWGNQAWTKEMLILAKINPISYFRLTSERKGINQKLYKCDNYSYNMDYYWDKDVFRRKLYFPYKESYLKWLSNVNKTVVQNWNLLPKTGDTLFITSSYKDGGPIWRVYDKPIFIAPNAEGVFIPNKVFYKLKSRYKKIVLLFDNDETGFKYAKRFSAIYKIPYIFMPIGGPKDPADFYKQEGGREFNYYLQKGLKSINY